MPAEKDIDLSQMPLGPGHSIEDKLKWAHSLYAGFGADLKNERIISDMLENYRKNINSTWKAMEESGIIEECTRCAVQDGGSCCGQGIENKFDVITLLVNLLLGTRLPEQPWDPTGCWFLGEKGCLLTARHVICVNFMCKRLYAVVPVEKIRLVQSAMQAETDAGFLLEEYIKSWLAKNG
jgi:hypothetical protein